MEKQTTLRVLVVDDSADIAQMLVVILRRAGYEAIMSMSATEALELATQTDFDLVISDIGMPIMDGYELAKALRALPRYNKIPMIAVTGFAQYDDRERALDAGFNVHMKKPLDYTSLVGIIQQTLSS